MSYNNFIDLLNKKAGNVRQLAVLGVGSTLRADDGVGMYIVERLIEIFSWENCPGLFFCLGETAPENFSGAIKNFHPDHILVFDAADVGKMPGEAVEIDPACIGGPTFCSHLLPLRLMLDYLTNETGAEVTLVGIQYQSLEFDGEMTPEVRKSADSLVAAVEIFIRAHWQNFFI
jgi:hydrogenase 3 maturation protease